MAALVVLADSHLRAEDPDTDLFLRFLREVGGCASTLILAGDIFDLWVAREGLELPFHRAVVEAAADLRRRGVRVKYVQGNRDYFVSERYGSGPFAEVAEESLIEPHAGRRIHVAHGDLVNTRDRQYRLWRRASRSSPVRRAFGSLPPAAAARLSLYLERRFRTTNRRYRRGFPVEQAGEYARRAFAGGADTVVLGHFHEARVMEFPGDDGRARRLYVLPGWREDRRYLRFGEDGEGRFVEFRPRDPRTG